MNIEKYDEANDDTTGSLSRSTTLVSGKGGLRSGSESRGFGEMKTKKSYDNLSLGRNSLSGSSFYDSTTLGGGGARSLKGGGATPSLYSVYTRSSADFTPDLSSREVLNKTLGDDCIPQTTEIDSMPAAGLRIPHGPLRGLMAFRFVVTSADPYERLSSGINGSSCRETVVNFILDTGCKSTTINPDALAVLGYDRRRLIPGNSVKVRIQGVPNVDCVVGEDDEYSRLGVDFTISGSLSFYFDTRMGAPVLYVESETMKPMVDDIGRTVKPSLQQRMKSMIRKIRTITP